MTPLPPPPPPQFLANPNLLSLWISISYSWNNKIGEALRLASFTSRNISKAHPGWGMAEFFAPFHGRAVFHRVARSYFVYPFIHGWTLGLSPSFWQGWTWKGPL